jgi:hypothetical protein
MRLFLWKQKFYKQHSKTHTQSAGRFPVEAPAAGILGCANVYTGPLMDLAVKPHPKPLLTPIPERSGKYNHLAH